MQFVFLPLPLFRGYVGLYSSIHITMAENATFTIESLTNRLLHQTMQNFSYFCHFSEVMLGYIPLNILKMAEMPHFLL